MFLKWYFQLLITIRGGGGGADNVTGGSTTYVPQSVTELRRELLILIYTDITVTYHAIVKASSIYV